MIIIGLGHKKRVGKDTIAKFLKSELMMGGRVGQVEIGSFATKLKSVCHDLYGHLGIESQEFYDENPARRDDWIEELHCTVRDVWIKVGNILREVYDKTWVDYLIKNSTADVLIIPDIRYPNEAEIVAKSEGHLFKIMRNEAPGTKDIADCALDGINCWDAIFDNSGDNLGNAYKIAQRIIEEYIIVP